MQLDNPADICRATPAISSQPQQAPALPLNLQTSPGSCPAVPALTPPQICTTLTQLLRLAQVRLTMERETGWAAWKDAGCRDFQRPPAAKPEARPGTPSISPSQAGAASAAASKPGPGGSAAGAAGGQAKRPAPGLAQTGTKRQRQAGREPARRCEPPCVRAGLVHARGVAEGGGVGAVNLDEGMV